MKTILEALIDEIHYPLPTGFVENKLLARGLNGDDAFEGEVYASKEFQGCIADCLYSLISAPNVTEGDKSITMADKSHILAFANSIYSTIGEEPKTALSPSVRIIH